MGFAALNPSYDDFHTRRDTRAMTTPTITSPPAAIGAGRPVLGTNT